MRPSYENEIYFKKAKLPWGNSSVCNLTGGHHSDFGLPLPGFFHVSQPDFHGGRMPERRKKNFVRTNSRGRKLILRRKRFSSCVFCRTGKFSAGLHVPPKNYFKCLKKLLDQHEIDLVADEVVTGWSNRKNVG